MDCTKPVQGSCCWKLTFQCHFATNVKKNPDGSVHFLLSRYILSIPATIGTLVDKNVRNFCYAVWPVSGRSKLTL